MALDWKEIGAGLAAAVIGAGAIFHRVRRVNSRERVDAAKDEAETRIISRLESERDYARTEAQREREQRIADIARLARLETENRFLKSFIRRVLRVLSPEQRVIYETDFSALDEPAHAPPPPAVANRKGEDSDG